MVKALLNEFSKISNAGVHIPTVDKVKRVQLKGPVLLCIVNLELTIWGNPEQRLENHIVLPADLLPLRLDWRKIYANYLYIQNQFEPFTDTNLAFTSAELYLSAISIHHKPVKFIRS